MAAENKPEDEHGHLKIYLPKKLLECLPKCSSLPKERHRWNTNEEIAAYLISFEKHEEWLTTSPKTRPQNGSMILYNRKKVKYRKDGYCWKKRKDGKTTREDHMKLKVQGVECLYGCYVHSSIIPTFHRRCYWLLQNPDIVLVHYLNVPAIEDCGKPCGPILCSINTDKKEWAKWTKEELISQLKPMFHGIKWTCSNGNSSTGFSAEQLVQQILDSHQTKPPPRTHNCLCTGTLGAGSSLHHKCNSAKHRIISPKVDPRSGGAYSSTHSEVQNSDVSEGKTEHTHGAGKNGRATGDTPGGSTVREKRNSKGQKPALLHQNSMEVSSSNQVEVPDTTQCSPVSISSGLNSDPDMADSPVVTGMSHVASVMSSLSQSATVFMSEVTGDPVYSMSPTGDPNTHLLGPDTASSSLVLAVAADSHKFAFPGSVGVGLGDVGSTERLAMLSAASMSEELVLSSNLESGSIKLPETTMNFDPDCFLNNPKQGQTYGGNGLKAEVSNASSCSNRGVCCSPPLTDNGYGFNAALVKNIKTEDTSFEQQLAKEGGYQVGEVVSGTASLSSSSGSGSTQSSLALTPTSSLLPSGGGLSPSTTLEQMDFSAIDAKQDFSSTMMSATSYGQAIPSPQLAHQSHSPSFFLQSSPQSTQTQTHQNTSTSAQNSHDSSAFMGLSVVKTDSTGTNGHHHHHHHHSHQGQQTASNCNGSSPTERNGQGGTLQLLQYQNHFTGASKEHEEVGSLEQPTNSEGQDTGGQEKQTEDLLKAGDHLQHCVGNGSDGSGASEHYLQQPESTNLGAGGAGRTGTGTNSGTLCNGTDGNRTTGSPHQQLQPLLQGAGLVQGLFNNIAAHQALATSGANGGGTMEISLDHFDVSFGNQFSDLINDFISVEGGNSAAIGGQTGNTLYSHQIMAHSGTERQVSSGGNTQQVTEEGPAHGATGYNSAELCLQPCCSPQSAQPGALGTDTGQLAYMQVEEVVSAAVAHGTIGMLQNTGRLFVVTDYSPEWSYPEGGVKVLITGPWQEASSDYTCLFDQITVPASLIQPGVLRCYCPAHDTGLVTLQVAASSQIISNSVVFEYKARALPALPTSQHDWLSLDDNQFRMSILERLEQMERRMAEMSGQQQQQGSGGTSESGATGGGGGGGGGEGRGNADQTQLSPGQSQSQGQAGSSFESRVVVVCEKMMNRACWAKSKHLIHSKTFRGMTLLHLAAAQGYANLIQTLIKWRTKHADSIDLELEVDPLNVDHFSCTPLMWACALGHMEAAIVLYKWDRRALAIPDSLGRLPLATARSRGHTKLAECLENLQREEQQQQTSAANMSFSSSAESSTTEGWMNVWGSETASGMRASNVANCAPSSNQDLRRPRSESSIFYNSEGQSDAPLTKKHKPNPEIHQARQSKPGATPVALEEQVHKTKTCPTKAARAGTMDKESGKGDKAQTKLGSACGGGRWSGRQAAGRRGQIGGLAKERLANRLRLREASGAGSVSELLVGQEDLENTGDLQLNMMTLAEHIIEATPDRIKSENFEATESAPLDSVEVNSTMSWLATYLGDAERFLYSKPLACSTGLGVGHTGNHPESEGPFGKLGLPSPADWNAFLNVSHSKKERDLTQLALSDHEQRELYEAARQVQSTFRKYKGRPLREQQELAAAVIQRCYKKYKQVRAQYRRYYPVYHLSLVIVTIMFGIPSSPSFFFHKLTWIALKYALYKKMTLAAILIQSKFRSYYEQKKFQQSRRAAMLIQQYYRSYKELGRPNSHSHAAAAAALVQHKLRSGLLTKRQDQAARKIMRFLIRCRHRARELKKAKEHESSPKSPVTM
ncbi:calmodulin-binding transcription activator 1-like isoform X1 [Tachysurus fulvidraco]|uniref:calmodulin-binding transcription activator 1-like isoform X1 n=1 Tax=Tachysurus fulvidraco TaxID=1234273 RepID=UPI001FEDB1D6|nr:calmodulin-binding transcription activator 1-like isoform X1 [Tachysurus fulvidraco]